MVKDVPRFLLASGLVLGGAVVGGIFPGAALAFFMTVGSQLSGSAGEVFCFIVNIALGIGGSSIGGLFARLLRPGTRWPYNFLFPVIAGSAAGAIGYFWLDWAISHADPPL